jgi:small GTP-binding protein
MIGDPHVGKTTLFWKYMEGEFLAERSSNVTTIDFKIKEVKLDGTAIKLFIWDTAGQEKYRAIVSTYFNGCQGVMMLFDLTRPDSFTSATTKWFETAKAKSPDAVFLLVGNKSDLEPRVDEKEAQEWARRNRVRYIRVSVKNDVNVSEGYQMLSEAIFRRPAVEKSKSFTLRTRDVRVEQAKQKKCCS